MLSPAVLIGSHLRDLNDVGLLAVSLQERIHVSNLLAILARGYDLCERVFSLVIDLQREEFRLSSSYQLQLIESAE